MALGWYRVRGIANRGEVPIDAEILAASQEEAESESLWIAGAGATWNAPPEVTPPAPDDKDEQE